MGGATSGTGEWSGAPEGEWVGPEELDEEAGDHYEDEDLEQMDEEQLHELVAWRIQKLQRAGGSALSNVLCFFYGDLPQVPVEIWMLLLKRTSH